MQYLYPVLKFLVGGGIITGVTYLTRSVHPAYAGILAAAPITTTLAFLFTSYETTQGETQKLVLASFAFAVPTLAFLFVLYLCMNRWSFLGSLCAAYLVWAGSVLILIRAVPFT